MTAKKPPTVQEALAVLGYTTDLVVARKGSKSLPSINVSASDSYPNTGLLGRQLLTCIEELYRVNVMNDGHHVVLNGKDWETVFREASEQMKRDSLQSPGYILGVALERTVNKVVLAKKEKGGA